MKKILVLFFLFSQLDAYAQVVGTPYMQPSSTNGTAVVSEYTCNDVFAIPFDAADIANGIMKVGTPVSGVTQSITATVIKTGTYTIAATANGVTFSASGTFTQTGNQTIQLSATGTPLAKGDYTFILNTAPSCGCVRYTTLTGVYASVNGTLTDFGTHNLGANTNLDPKTYVVGNTDGSGGTLGFLYQWGRTTDGHQLRISQTEAGPKTATAPIANKFIIVSSGNWLNTNDNTLWGDGTTKGSKDPCPTGFRVPTRTQWVNLYSVGSSGGNPSILAGTQPTQNTWTFTGIGYRIGPLLFIPTASSRIGSSGQLNALDSGGRYWSSTTRTGSSSNQAFANVLNINSSGYVQLSTAGLGSADKSTGCSVRCISE